MNNRLRIAIADDDPLTRDFLRRMLVRMGHDVVCSADDGRELADRCLQLVPDLVITDVTMPQLDGISAAAQIARHHDIPIILLSGSELPSEIEPLRHVNVLATRLKPISRVELEAAVRDVIQLSESLVHIGR